MNRHIEDIRHLLSLEGSEEAAALTLHKIREVLCTAIEQKTAVSPLQAQELLAWIVTAQGKPVPRGLDDQPSHWQPYGLQRPMPHSFVKPDPERPRKLLEMRLFG